MRKFEHRVNVEEAMNWELYKQSLNQELVDAAERFARDKYGRAFDDLEVDTSITRDGDDFVVTFEWHEDDLPATRRVRISFDVITRRSGTADLDIPTGANAEEILNDYLNKQGDNLVEASLPEGVTVHQWDVQEPGRHLIETDWVEDAPPEEALA